LKSFSQRQDNAAVTVRFRVGSRRRSTSDQVFEHVHRARCLPLAMPDRQAAGDRPLVEKAPAPRAECEGVRQSVYGTGELLNLTFEVRDAVGVGGFGHLNLLAVACMPSEAEPSASQFRSGAIT